MVKQLKGFSCRPAFVSVAYLQRICSAKLSIVWKLNTLFCSGCKCPLCLSKFKDAEKKLWEYSKWFEIPLYELPLKTVIIHEVDPTTGKKKQVKLQNSCYHIAHLAQWKRFFSLIQTDNANSNDLVEWYSNYLLLKNKENESQE